MAEHESDREGREPDEQKVPFDEDAAWRAIVEGYGEEPADPPGARPFTPVEDLALPEPEKGAESDTDKAPVRPLGSSVFFAPGVGPRDHNPPEPSEDDFDPQTGHLTARGPLRRCQKLCDELVSFTRAMAEMRTGTPLEGVL